MDRENFTLIILNTTRMLTLDVTANFKPNPNPNPKFKAQIDILSSLVLTCRFQLK